MYGLFATAAAFIYPSRFEGFGIPVLEALAAGIPAACSQLPSLIEIAQGTVRFFDPNQVDDIAAALEEITTPSDEREQRRQAGIRRAQNFSWERSARALIEALTEAAYPATRSKKSHD